MFYRIFLSLSLLITIACGSQDGNTEQPRNSNLDDLNGAAAEADAVTADNGVYSVSIVWEQDRLRAGLDLDHEATVEFFNRDGAYAEDVRFSKFYLNMPGMGHGTDTENQRIVATELPWQFKVQGVSFNMMGRAGHWKVNVKAEVNGTEDSVTVDLPEVGR